MTPLSSTDEAEALTALEAGLGTAAATSKAAEEPHPEPMARRLLLRRRAADADRRSSGIESEHLRNGASALRIQPAPGEAETTVEALRACGLDTDSVCAGGGLGAEYPVWDAEPSLGRASVWQE
ncbi:hypothetical protein ACFZCG_17175 [Streptomyces tanashiensis]|uniref:hypothetical protein n=1 Tax=Streptomyces tanashiensis TaxID=67367 RepID=UPI0036E30ED3